MALVGVVLVLAVLLGRALRGRLRRLAELPLTRPGLVLLAASAQLTGGVLAAVTGSAAAQVAGSVVAAALVAAFCLRNLAVAGVPLVGLGLLLNAAVVAANGAMPVAPGAAAAAGMATGPIADGRDPRHTLLGDGTVLAPLADRIPLPLPVLPSVVSAGDVLVAAGVGLLVVTGMTGRALDRGRGQAGRGTDGPTGWRPTVRARASTTRGSYS